MDRVKENLRRGLVLSEQYAGKGTGAVAWAKVAAALEHHGLIDAYDQKMVHGTTIEMKPHALAVTGGIPLSESFCVALMYHLVTCRNSMQ